MGKISIYENKILALSNVLSIEVNGDTPDPFNRTANLMENFARTMNCRGIGPHIQRVHTHVSNSGAVSVKIELLRQIDEPIKVRQPYSFEENITLNNCILSRYEGPEEKISFGMQKLFIYAFEKNITLTLTTYTVYVNCANGLMVADIFVEKKND